MASRFIRVRGRVRWKRWNPLTKQGSWVSTPVDGCLTLTQNNSRVGFAPPLLADWIGNFWRARVQKEIEKKYGWSWKPVSEQDYALCYRCLDLHRTRSKCHCQEPAVMKGDARELQEKLATRPTWVKPGPLDPEDEEI